MDCGQKARDTAPSGAPHCQALQRVMSCKAPGDARVPPSLACMSGTCCCLATLPWLKPDPWLRPDRGPPEMYQGPAAERSRAAAGWTTSSWSTRPACTTPCTAGRITRTGRACSSSARPRHFLNPHFYPFAAKPADYPDWPRMLTECAPAPATPCHNPSDAAAAGSCAASGLPGDMRLSCDCSAAGAQKMHLL